MGKALVVDVVTMFGLRGNASVIGVNHGRLATLALKVTIGWMGLGLESPFFLSPRYVS